MKTQIKTFILISICLLSVVISKEEVEFLKENILQRLSNTPSDFENYTYSIQWGSKFLNILIYLLKFLDTFCLTKSACREKSKHLKRNVFTVHGLWPNGPGGIQLPTCNQGDHIDFEINDDNLQENMNKHWPSLTGPNEGFWEHEYNKHGYCYAYKYGGGQTKFFNQAMDLFLENNFENIIHELVEDSEEEEVLIGHDNLRNFISEKYPGMVFDIDCKIYNHNNYLQEIRIYYDLDFQPQDLSGSRKDNCIKNNDIRIPRMID